MVDVEAPGEEPVQILESLLPFNQMFPATFVQVCFYHSRADKTLLNTLHKVNNPTGGHQNWEIVGPDSFTEAFLR